MHIALIRTHIIMCVRHVHNFLSMYIFYERESNAKSGRLRGLPRILTDGSFPILLFDLTICWLHLKVFCYPSVRLVWQIGNLNLNEKG